MCNLSKFVWENKYRRTCKLTGRVDQSLDETFARVVRHVLSDSCEDERVSILQAFRDLQLLPGGRILAGAGCSEGRTLVNTFVIDRLNGTPENTLLNLTISAETMRAGGGIGCNLSDVPPRGELLPSGGASPGVIEIMELWNDMCAALMSSKVQRGAMMMVLDCNHPEIFDFIDAKQARGRLEHMNISVFVSDRFMTAQAENDAWSLEFGGRTRRRISARSLWNSILRRAYEGAEPGVIFIDTIRQFNNLGYKEEIIATNSCAEQPLPRHGSSPLASINLTQLVTHPFSDTADLDLDELRRLARLGVRFLDETIDRTAYPIEEQRCEAQKKRRIGLGITGLADALAMCNLRYGAPASIAMIARWMQEFRNAAYAASCELAAEKGPCEELDRSSFLSTRTGAQLPEVLRERIRQHGLRNAAITTIAPTGSISLLAGNVSPGVEPVFAHQVRRTVRDVYGRRHVVVADSYVIKLYRQLYGATAKLPDTMVTVADLSVHEHLIVQSAVQRYIDASISKTVNFSPEASFDDFANTYDTAFSLGCKSVSCYVPNELRGSILVSLDSGRPYE